MQRKDEKKMQKANESVCKVIDLQDIFRASLSLAVCGYVFLCHCFSFVTDIWSTPAESVTDIVTTNERSRDRNKHTTQRSILTELLLVKNHHHCSNSHS